MHSRKRSNQWEGKAMKKYLASRTLLALSLILIFFASASIVKADPAANIRVIPVGGVHTGEPIITKSPANIIIFSTSGAHSPITNVWLILSINKDTYDHLVSIITDITTSFAKSDFAEAVEAKIPPEAASPPYPGSKDQYEVSAIKDALGTTDKIYYAYKAFDISTITTTPQTFTLTVNAPGVTKMRVLVLAIGYDESLDTKGDGVFNQKTPYSGSTLVIPEIATLALIASTFSALGIYGIKRIKK